MSNGTEISTMNFHLTSAQILALFSSPVQLIPAQGLKTIILPVFCYLRCNFGGVAYTTAAANLFLGYLPALPGNGFMAISQVIILGQSTSRSVLMLPNTSTFQGDTPANSENQGLGIGAATQNPTLGNGSLDIVLGYQIVPTP